MKGSRRAFIRNVALSSFAMAPVSNVRFKEIAADTKKEQETFNEVAGEAMYTYSNERLNHIAFPIGGMGAGMFCLEGSGSIAQLSIDHHPDLFNEPPVFAAIHVKGVKQGTKVLESLVPDRKKYGIPFSGSGGFLGNVWGLPRFSNARFTARFPFAEIELADPDIPLKAAIKGWSPFIPSDEDNSSLPVGALEYNFENTSDRETEYVFSYNARQWMKSAGSKDWITSTKNGFVLRSDTAGKRRDFAIACDQENVKVDACWFRGNWFDPLTVIWKKLEKGMVYENKSVAEGAPGASLFVPFTLAPGEKKTISILFSWFVPFSELQAGSFPKEWQERFEKHPLEKYYRPWYTSRYDSIEEVSGYWRSEYTALRNRSELFSRALFSSTIPPVLLEALTSNLSILKSPTVLRQRDGRLWLWEGSGDKEGYARGSCTHVWNYAQAIAHLFPALERTLRHTEFNENQNEEGRQGFRANLPITPIVHDYHPAADGQLGGILKVYRDWRISGNAVWLADVFPKVRKSLDYCISTWDPKWKGTLEEPHHNTYDIEFWGGDGMCTSIYLAALQAFVVMADYLGLDVARYRELARKTKQYLETRLFNGEYFIQQTEWRNLVSPPPQDVTSVFGEYSPEARRLIAAEGPNYQYGNGCLSDGIIGSWFSQVAGLGEAVDQLLVRSHLNAVFRYNFRKDLTNHVNPQRPTYAMGKEAGLLLCTWPKGGEPTLPLIYCNEIWSGIEYQVASHLIFAGEMEKALTIITACRSRYDGRTRNPFNEFEYGNWYGRALASYSLLQAATGMRYDAMERVLYIDSRIGNFKGFLAFDGGFCTVQLDGKSVVVTLWKGSMEVKFVMLSGKKIMDVKVENGL